MKNWLKILCAMTVAGVLALTAAAADAAVDTAAAEELTLPKLVHAEEIKITSSMVSDGTDPVPMYDQYAETAVTLENLSESVDLSFTSSEAFRLHAFVVNQIDEAYKVTLYASNDSSEWVELKHNVKNNGDFVEYQVKNLGRDYKFYRMSIETEEEALTFHTLAMYQKTVDVWPFSLRHMFRPAN